MEGDEQFNCKLRSSSQTVGWSKKLFQHQITRVALNVKLSVILMTINLFLSSADQEGFGEYLKEAGYITISILALINSEDVSILCRSGGGEHLLCGCLF